MKTLGIYQFIHNATEYDYPFEESLDSALPIADEIVIAECASTDDTLKRVESWIQKHPDKKIKLLQHPWVNHFTQLSGIGNYAASFLDTDWHWQLQSDEVIHENSYPEVKNLIENAPDNITALSVKYTHMLANYETEFDFCYRKAVRIARKNSYWQLHGDACQLGGEDFSRSYNSDIMVFHYGKVHAGRQGWKKEWDFQQLFVDIGFPDKKMMEMKEKLGEEYCDYLYLFQQDIKDGKVRKFEGTHPKVMEKRIKEFKEGGWEQFNSKIIEGLTLK